MKTNFRKAILLLFTLFIIVRIAILFSSDEIIHPEEARQGNLAHALLSDQEIRIDDFLYQKYEGSCLLDGLLVAGAYALTGGSGYSLKIVTLLISFLILLFSAAVAREIDGRRPPRFLILMFTFAPTYFITYHFHSIGGSLYGSLLNIMLFLLAIKIVRQTRRLFYLLWGFLCAVGIFLNPACLPGIVMSFAIVFIVNKRLLISRDMLLWVVSFVISAGLFAAIFSFDIPAFRMVSELFLQRDFTETRALGGIPPDTGFFSRLIHLFLHDLPHSFYFIGTKLYGALYYALIIGLVLLSNILAGKGWKKMLHCLAGKKTSGSVNFVPAAVNLYILVYFLLFLLSDILIPGSPEMLYYDIVYKFFYNVYPFLFLSAAFALDETVKKFSRYTIAVYSLYTIAVLPALICTFYLVKPQQFTFKSKFRPYDVKYLGRMLPYRFQDNRLPGAIDACRKMPYPERLECTKGVAIDCRLSEQSMTKNFTKARNCCSRFPVEDRWLCVMGLGNRILETFFLDVDSIIEFCGRFGPAYFDFCLQGYIEEIGDMIYREPSLGVKLLKGRSENQKSILLGHMATWVFYMFQFNPEWAFQACRKLEHKLNVGECSKTLSAGYGMLDALGRPGVREEHNKTAGENTAAFAGGFGFATGWKLFPEKEEALDRCRKMEDEIQIEACSAGAEDFYTMVKP